MESPALPDEHDNLSTLSEGVFGRIGRWDSSPTGWPSGVGSFREIIKSRMASSYRRSGLCDPSCTYNSLPFDNPPLHPIIGIAVVDHLRLRYHQPRNDPPLRQTVSGGSKPPNTEVHLWFIVATTAAIPVY